MWWCRCLRLDPTIVGALVRADVVALLPELVAAAVGADVVVPLPETARQLQRLARQLVRLLVPRLLLRFART